MTGRFRIIALCAGLAFIALGLWELAMAPPSPPPAGGEAAATED